MDRTAWIVVILCVVGLVAWEFWLQRQNPARFHQAPAITSPTATPAAGLAPVPSPAPSLGSSPVSPSPTPQPSASVAAFAEKTETLSNSDIELHITNRGGGIRDAVVLQQVAEGGKRVTLNSSDLPPIGAMIDQPAAPVLPEFTINRDSDGSVKLERAMPEGVSVRKKFSFLPSPDKQDNFLIEFDLDLVNGGNKSYTSLGYYLELGSAVPIHSRDYPYYTRLVWSIDGRAHDKNVSWFAGGSGLLGIGQRAPQTVYEEHTAAAEWAAVSDQFFATIIAPLSVKADGVWGRRLEINPEQRTYGIEGAMHMPGFEVPPGQTYSARFQIWAGPKIYHRLAQLGQNQAEIMNFGLFKLVSQFLLNFMNLLHRWLWSSYAAAILALTIIIRSVLWPLQTKANRSMRQTALLGPKMQELREKYKDDPTKMNQEVMKLYKEYGINPVGGCLPMAIQIPIFFGLYQMLAQAVELRNAKFLWVHDLSQPDTVGHLPVLGWPINIIPLCMAVTQLLLMQMTPKTGDATQRRVMMFTPLIFLFFCYNFAAALALYYTTQNVFSILQFYLNKKQPMPKLEKVTSPGKRK